MEAAQDRFRAIDAFLVGKGLAAVVLDTGAVTRGSGSRNEDKERNIRKWFVDQDLARRWRIILLTSAK